MKKFSLKIASIILLIIQIAFTIKTILILKPFLVKLPNNGGIEQYQKMLILATFVFSIIIIVSLIIIIFYLKNKTDIDNKDRLTQKTDETQKNANKKSDTKTKLLEVGKDKRETVEKLLTGLETEKQKHEFFNKLLKNIADKYDIVQGIVFIKNQKDKKYKKEATYAFYKEEEARDFEEEVGISGQVAANRQLLNISKLPDKYLTVLSGLGSASPSHLIIFPILYKNKSIGVIEIATFKIINKHNEEILMNFSEILGDLVEHFR